VLNFGTKKQVAYLGVGDHPQRIRPGVITPAVVVAIG
jgi:hypothetical protein